MTPVFAGLLICHHEVVLRKTVKQMGVDLTGKLHGYTGSSVPKGYPKPIKWTTQERSVMRNEIMYERPQNGNFEGGKDKHTDSSRFCYPIHQGVISTPIARCSRS